MSSEQPSGNKLWGGRFTGATDPLMDLYNASLPYDKVMYDADLTGTKIYTIGLNKLGLINDEELKAIHSGLEEIREEWKQGKFIENQVMKIFIQLMKEDWVKLLVKIFLVKFILVDLEMIKLQLI